MLIFYMRKNNIVLGLFVFVFLLVVSIFTLLPSQIRADWTEHQFQNNEAHTWQSIASSSDGTRLVAVVNPGYV